MGVCYHIQLMFLYQNNAALLGNNGEVLSGLSVEGG